MAGSRLGILLEKQKELDLVASLREAGFLPAIPSDSTESNVVASVPAEAEQVVEVKKPSRFGSNS